MLRFSKTLASDLSVENLDKHQQRMFDLRNKISLFITFDDYSHEDLMMSNFLLSIIHSVVN